MNADDVLRADGPHYLWPYVDEPLESAVQAQLHSSLSDRDGSGVIGEFEQAFAEFVGSKNALAFSSGTAALHAMCAAAGLGPGDAIVAPAYTFFATATPFAYEGVQCIFADADETGNVTAETIAHVVRPNVRAVIVTHMWGNMCDMKPIVELCRQNNLLLLEDCSHAHFATSVDGRAGSFGDMAMFSTNQKPITTGEGGILTTRDAAFRDLALLHGHYNKRCFQEISDLSPAKEFAFTGMGLKSRMTTLSAAIGVDQLRKATHIEERRRQVLSKFFDGLRDNPIVSLLGAPDNNGLYVTGFRFHEDAATVSRDEFVAMLQTAGAREFDVPGSTRAIGNEPLFSRQERNSPWVVSDAAPAGAWPGADGFARTFFKCPIWGYPGDGDLVDAYVDLLIATSEAIHR